MEKSALGHIKRIVLTGFMGSGKSTVGQLLARRLSWSFVDLDVAVAARCGRAVPEIFASYGEAHFRTEEAAALYALIQKANTVIALGGGAAETPAVRTLLQQAESAAVIFLQAPFEILEQRCLLQAKQPGATSRPLLSDREEALNRYRARLQHYEAIATFRLDTAGLSPDHAAEAILEQLM